MALDGLTHLNERGEAHMVDVSQKKETERVASAEARVVMKPETLQAITQRSIPKGDVFATARVAGIMAAKKTSELIPLCHPLMLTRAEVECAPFSEEDGTCGVHVTTTIGLNGKTGVEMEALTAASVAALTIYDMCKAIDRGMQVEAVRVTHKEGGRSGTWDRIEDDLVPTLPQGTVRAVCISKRKGTRKQPVEGTVSVKPDWGIEEDAHAGDWHRQVSLLAWESIVRAQEMGLDVKEGDFAENVTTEGLDLLTLPMGTQIRIGEDVLLELTQVGKVCHTRCAIYHLAGDCIFPREGIFFAVLKGGKIKAGDPVRVVKMGDGFSSHTPEEALEEMVEYGEGDTCATAARALEKLSALESDLKE